MLPFLAVAALIAAPTASADRGPQTPVKQPTAVGTGGAATTVDPLATQAAIDVLRRGGNAVDAAVAAAGVLGVVEPYSCGIGGGGFMTIYSARDRRVHTIDSRETAPAAMGPSSFAGLTTFESQRVSGMSVGVPGTLRAWQSALREFGTWPLRKALKPGIQTAQEGFAVDPTFFAQTDAAKAIFADFPATAALYLNPDGTPKAVGTVIRNPDLARTYELIARRGPDALYSGALAQAIVDTVQRPPLRPGSTRVARPGVMTLDDLARYRTVDRDPTAISYRGLKILGMGPPSSGGSTVAEALNILEGYDLGALPREQALHDYLEASRYAFADRNRWVGDPGFVSVPLAGLLSKSFAAERRALITDHAATSPVAPGDPTDNPGDQPTPDTSVGAARVGSTTNMTIADRFGNVVEYTFTIEQTGGNGMVVPGYGFLLNNELTDFNLNPDGSSTPTDANAVAGGKRPRSSIAPTIVLRDGRPFVAVGSPGGATIITTVLQILVNRVDFGMTLPDAIAAPRASQRNTAKTDVEPAFLAQTDIVNALTARGHQFNAPAEIGAATGIEFLDDGDVLAAAEPVRRGGGSAMVVRPDAGGGGGGPGGDDNHGDEARPGNDGRGGGHHTMHPLGARAGAR
ncbi:MAG: gamma-glutamyltranspeptidase / glutathione hydrolase [Solirubrobacteraceae bacterium]|nr:gamma-glutamyltranspeptidase / glutathione hydrolase [Solirubrobacteraceae bacterium]